jgi:hypothetical protein
LIWKLLDDRDTSDAWGVNMGACFHCDLICKAVWVEVLIINTESFWVRGLHVGTHAYSFHSLCCMEEYQHFLEVWDIWLFEVGWRFHPEIVSFHD